MRRLLLPFAALLALSLLASDSPRDDDATTVAVTLDGEWQLVSQEIQGKTTTNPQDGMIFRKGEFTWTGPGFNPKGDYKVDAARTPAWVDMTATNMPQGSYVLVGIYLTDGDLLKMAWNSDTAERPRGFESSPDTRVLVYTFKRVRK